MFFSCLFMLVASVLGDRQCPPGQFILPNLPQCRPLLNCTQLSKINVGELIGVGGVKAVYNASWNNYSLALSILNNPKYIADFQYGQKMLLEYSGYPGFIKLIGFCEKPALTLTEYHRFGSVANLSTIINEYNVKDNLKFRLKMCLDWSKILLTLHGEGPIKTTRIMCDSNSVRKLLSQILLDQNLNLILNDLDALPKVNLNGIICGHGPIDGELVAPEQKWPFPSLPFNESLMPGYNEKIDIWKAAKVCDYFLNVTGSEWTKYRLFNLHKKCLRMDPNLRPCASELAQEYQNALAELKHDEL